ncbi:glutathione transferase [Lentithecium fluviatile CBS 122367]|uniref:glutathione transferase n=1 Tax=Lentithecium fluviatile CBS 122367 TaxID=1168545 RepID=A0A6G1J0A4_9PLEO|nr:glutathione transferase [Lentithecium fluviatile CBS 122367]
MASESNQQGAKITVHWLNKSRGQRVIWLLEELNLNYDIKTYARDKNKRAPVALKEVHPLGKSPTISIEVAGCERPLVLAESGAIVEYLCEHFGQRLVPRRYPEGKEGGVGQETEEWINYRYFMHYAEGSMFPVLFTGLLTGSIRSAPVPFFIKPITNKIAGNIEGAYTNPELKVQYTFMEDFLTKSQEKGEFFLGSDLSAVDFMMFFVLEGGVQHGSLTEESYPKLYNYVRRMQDRKAYQRAGDRVTKASGEKFVPFSEARM